VEFLATPKTPMMKFDPEAGFHHGMSAKIIGPRLPLFPSLSTCTAKYAAFPLSPSPNSIRSFPRRV
jgi:hypothetical protein